MNNFIKENWFKITLLAFFILIGIFTTYYFFIFIPQRDLSQQLIQEQERLAKEIQEQQKIESQKLLQEQQKIDIMEESLNLQKQTQQQTTNLINQKQALLNICLEKEQQRYQAVWDNYLSEKAPANMKIPAGNDWYTMWNLNENKNKEEINICYQRYPSQ